MKSVDNEDGAVLITAVLFLPVMILFLIFVVDVGNWWVHKRHLQLQVDAAAIAGGDRFAGCFSMPDKAYANAIAPEATKYGGGSGSVYNQQIGGANKGSIDLRFNSQTYANGEVDPEWGSSDFPATQDACQSQVFDVKATESNLPLFFGSFIPGFSLVPAINAHARVRLYQAKAAAPDLPLAVPDVAPRAVAATFFVYDPSGKGADKALPGCGSCVFPLTRSGVSGGLQLWTGSADITVPNGATEIGMRVGLGNIAGSCANVVIAPGNEYTCYDQDGSTPLVLIHGYPTGGTPHQTDPIEYGVWEQTGACGVNTSSPFFSEVGGGSCTEYVHAQVSFGVPDPTSINAKVFANGKEMVYDKTTKTWSTDFTYPVADGPEPVALTWTVTSWGTCTTKKPCKGSFEDANGASVPYPEQQGYSADDDPGVTGPVKLVALSGGSGDGAPYTFKPGKVTLSITVGLQVGLADAPVGPTSPTVMLRFQVNSSKSITTAIACNGSGDSDFLDAIRSGCKQLYQINPTGSCDPDPAPPGPADCVPTKTGALGVTVATALDARFGCPANNWPAYQPDNDPRVVQLIVTNFSNLIGTGKTLVPVDNIGAFYVTGWDSQAGCNANASRPIPKSKKATDLAAIWGHYIKWVDPSDIPSTTTCVTPGNNIIPCVPALVR